MCMMKEANIKNFKLEWNKELYNSLINELTDLETKIKRLNNFISTNIASGYMTEIYLSNMKNQLLDMRQYHEHLENRIKLLEELKYYKNN